MSSDNSPPSSGGAKKGGAAQTSNTPENERKVLYHVEAVVEACRLIVAPGDVIELRALEATTKADRWPHTASGYFDDAEKLAEALRTITSAKGIYITPNPVEPALLARAANRIRKTPKGESTADTNIVRRRWLLIDADPQRPSGISSTDAEHESAIERARSIYAYLKDCGWPDPIAADSGNGAHLMYPVDLPADDAGLVQRCLASLAGQFDDEAVAVDTTVYNPGRIWKLYGTLACKGDDTPERPHRLACILSRPDEFVEVSDELLQSLAGEVNIESTAARPHVTYGGAAEPFDVAGFIARNNLDADGPHDWSGKQGTGRRWTFRTSPMCDHHDGAVHIEQHASGAITAGCHHNSCNWKWADLRSRLEPKSNGKHVAPASGTADVVRAVPAVRVEPYRPFPVDVLPEPASGFVREAAREIGCDPSFIALPLLACLAEAVGNSRSIRLKRGWCELPIIWAAIVGKSGTHKTPAMNAATAALKRKQGEAIKQYENELKQYERDKAEFDREYKHWLRNKSGGNPPEPPRPPICHRYIVGDITIEALAERLSDQFDGVLMIRDELAGWVDGIAEYKGGKGSDTGHWLAAWSGEPMIVDRKTGAKKMIHVPRASVSLVGGIQPGILRRAIAGEHMQDGLCARLLLTMPDPKPVRWTDAELDVQTERAMATVFDRLLELEPAANPEGAAAPFRLSLSADAKTEWVSYYNRHRAEQADLDDDLAAAWSKLEAYTARFALIFQLVRWAAGEAGGEAIDVVSIRAGIALSDWFAGEARRVYGTFAETEAERDRRRLVEWIANRGAEVTAREVQQGQRRFKTAGDAEEALDDLTKAGCGVWQQRSASAKGGRPTRVFKLSARSTSTEPPQTSVIGGCVDVDTVDTSQTDDDDEESTWTA